MIVCSINCLSERRGKILLVSKLSHTFPLLIMLVINLYSKSVQCAAKGGNLDECVNTNILCYDCDSRFDPNCADPFGEESLELSASPMMNLPINGYTVSFEILNSTLWDSSSPAPKNSTPSARTNSSVSQQNSTSPPRKKHRHLPPVQACHGCCVKLTSKLSNGVPYVKRMCISNLSINYFMVGLVCMKESGDRGRLCFCETDYCNGQNTNFQPKNSYVLIIISVLAPILYSSLISTSRRFLESNQQSLIY